jgi:hypothetical protein
MVMVGRCEALISGEIYLQGLNWIAEIDTRGCRRKKAVDVRSCLDLWWVD